MNLYVYLKGGLGNQMFQYAAGLSALTEYSQFTNLKLDISFYIGEDYSGDRDSGHLYLMQACKNHIIANSSFSWWSAFLSNSSYTIAPKKCRLDSTGCDIILDNWEKI